MSATWRFFRLDDDGSIENLSKCRFQRLWDGVEPCLEFAGRSIRIAQVLVHIESRRVRQILRIDGLKLYFDGNTGYLDEGRRQEWIRLEVQAVDPAHRDAHNIPGLVARRALSRIKAEYTFTPSSHELRAISAHIFRWLDVEGESVNANPRGGIRHLNLARATARQN